LDTLEEELLSIADAVSPSSKISKAGTSVEEREEEELPEEDGWMEVGRRNRMVVTRTVGFSAHVAVCENLIDLFLAG
jgi:ubiquitin carboxyl-terminal hydrolase 10